MTTSHLQKQIIEEVGEFFSSQDYQIDLSDQGLAFVQDFGAMSKVVYLILSDYGQVQIIHKPTGGIRFPRVERIRKNILQQEDWPNVMTLSMGLEPSLDNWPVEGRKVGSPQDLSKAVPMIMEEIETSIFPFFNKYKSIGEVDQVIQNTPVIDLHKLIGQEVVGRRMIIMKLAGNDKFTEYVDLILNYFADEARKGNMQAKTDFEKYEKLSKYLKEQFD